MASICTISSRSIVSYPSAGQGDVRIPFSVSDAEFAEDMALLLKGEMSPEEHRRYIARKYSQPF